MSNGFVNERRFRGLVRFLKKYMLTPEGRRRQQVGGSIPQRSEGSEAPDKRSASARNQEVPHIFLDVSSLATDNLFAEDLLLLLGNSKGERRISVERRDLRAKKARFLNRESHAGDCHV